jgi:hypothetical protein
VPDAETDVVGGGPVTQVETDDLEVESNSESAKEMTENFNAEEGGEPEPTDEEKASEAAKELGKRGGEAAAKARADRDKEDESEKTAKEDAAADKALRDAGIEPEDKAKKHEGQPKFDPRARVQEATRKLAEERDRNRALEERLARLEARAQGLAPEPGIPQTPPAEEPPPMPVLNNYENHEDWVRDIAAWQAERATEKVVAKKLEELKKSEAQQAEIRAQADQALRRVQVFNERIESATAADPQFFDKVDPQLFALRPTFLLPPNQPPLAENDLAQAIVESKRSSELLIHLTAHPEVVQEILALPDSGAVRQAMGALEAMVAGPPAPAKQPAAEAPMSEAKPPVRPLGGSPQVPEEDVSDDTPLDDHIRIMNAREARARRGR